MSKTKQERDAIMLAAGFEQAIEPGDFVSCHIPNVGPRDAKVKRIEGRTVWIHASALKAFPYTGEDEELALDRSNVTLVARAVNPGPLVRALVLAEVGLHTCSEGCGSSRACGHCDADANVVNERHGEPPHHTWVVKGAKVNHAPGCVLDAALSAAGYDRDKRDGLLAEELNLRGTKS